ncbi:GMC-OxRdtase-N domain-containing protein [Mycena kentingensis (nom. inval.)]|nr:GMC-OxRdtase-N domain-containing protein [Mycena kentingensis (nom. inval.)]
MKFSTSLSALLVAASCIASTTALPATESNALVARQRFGRQGRQRQGGNRGGNRGGQQANGGQQQQGAGQQQQAGAGNNAAAGAGNNAAAGGANGAATGGGNGGGNGDLQSSTTIDPSVIQTTGTGQDPPVDGQSAALVSKNNFINFCVPTLPKTPITNGLQTTTGSCNPTPIGLIPAVGKMPSVKFQSPANLDTIAANTPFTISVAVKNIQLGTFTNAQQTYFANPQTLNGQGEIIGHVHVVMELIDSLTSTTVTDPQKFFFFKGINEAQNGQGVVTAEVSAGAPAGVYRIGTIMSSATHQPAIVPVAQHGILDDAIYVTVTEGGAAGAGGQGAGGQGAANGQAGNQAGNQGNQTGNQGNQNAAQQAAQQAASRKQGGGRNRGNRRN